MYNHYNDAALIAAKAAIDSYFQAVLAGEDPVSARDMMYVAMDIV